MPSTRSRGPILAVVIAVVLASVLVPGAVAQQAGQPEGEPNDNPQNATFVAPGTPVSGEIDANGTNASGADSDWFAVPVQGNQTVTVTFESANESERLLVFLADPSRVENPQNASSNASDAVADIDSTMGEDTVTLNTTADQSGIYFLGVTGLSGEYTFTVETSAAAAMGENGTNATSGMNGTDMANGTAMANASSTTGTTTETATSTQTTQSTTTESTSAAATGGSGGDGGSGTASGEGTSASGPGFGLLAALVALLAAALLAVRRR